uniref:Uncharacterized protein n=1 Tax=Oryza sativa subsp. japonica TaxID=39947 RepID=Q67TS3_ORYSJ|nr:hypothetical protein [Oryza sativa Japonica Group]
MQEEEGRYIKWKAVMPDILNSQTSILTSQPNYNQLNNAILSSLIREKGWSGATNDDRNQRGQGNN